ncbi:MAG: ATP-binding protein [Synergistaceae bacterium]|nr:ATP-binding protein [Synergistaceae bacterium]
MTYVSDLDYNLLYVNERLANVCGIDKELGMKHKCYKAIRKQERPCSFCQLPELLPRKDSLPFKDFEYLWDDVLNIWLGGRDSIIRWVDGSEAHLRSVRDVSRKKRQLEVLEKALQASEAASVSKSNFLIDMSHKIRTPMNAILGIAEILTHDEMLEPHTKGALDKIYNSGELLLGIINDILDMSKIEAGKLELTRAEYETASLINDTATLNMMRIGGKPIEFELSVDENTPSSLFGDELRIKQILNNVLSNSFKYTSKGLVKLSLAAEAVGGGEESDVTLVFRVSDTGHGMTEEQVNKLFDEYSRFNMGANRKTEGTGLGMSITRNLARLMGGEIFVESELGKGTTCTVRLPQKRTSGGVLGRELAENLRKFRTNGAKQIRGGQMMFEPMPYGSALVVDDVESNLYVAKGLLTPYWLSVDTVMSGFDAIDKIKNGKVYDIVFMDHIMPGMDGIEAAKIIRGMGYAHPIVALTANALAGQSEMFLSNGFDDFISKPIDVRQLNAALKKHVRDKQPPEVIEAAFRQKGGLVVRRTEDGAARLAEVFVRDASKAVKALEAIQEKRGVYEDDDARVYVVNVHAMKSALVNVGAAELSAVAAKLEQAGRKGDTALMSAETPVFLDGLRALIESLTPPEEAGGDGGTADYPYLRERLLTVKKACETYDQKTAKYTLTELRQKAWPHLYKKLLAEMDEHLLGGDFEEVSRIAEELLKEKERGGG